ncbi:phosphoglycerate mutase-like protein [Laetiporus sulphureus 93-53]|uniref:Phosphoglycerate mutase-like protein n=1 Tax=Laetiporus sulphureus 93-53 TaxID=1314785 RepID=A0A165DYJ5_9APHY|nr:phosphoglycerate mutase-like protein [Laetiporus sulphureus 93-53]KZT05885.1 phosphoglycerate mutase-like protein [Laetiporus sulphureus 93-53]
MIFPIVLLVVLNSLPHALAAPPVDPAASSYVGSTTSDIFPPVGATVTADAEYFPDAEQVGFPGPTPTGAEPEAIATAPAAALNYDTYPLVAPLLQSFASAEAAFNPMRYWGNLSPWFSDKAAFGLTETSPQVPAGCELEQVHLLYRHGARYPTSGSAPSELAATLHSAATSEGFNANGPLAFLNTWTYKLGAEVLTPFGRGQPFNLGIGFRTKYGELLNEFTDLPVFRTTSEDRMLKSALNFAAGFFGVPDYLTSYNQLIIIENSGYNNTLAPWNACENANNADTDLSGWASGNWTQIYLRDAVSRLQPYLSGFNLTASDVYAMQQLCAYETVALGYSEFCGLFTPEEWEGFEYAIDLSFWYGDGPGFPAAAAQGIGYVQELLARLTKTPITTFDTSLNATLDGSNITFPLNQPIYADATHDTVIANIITALNFTSLAANGPLPIDHIPADQTYHVRHIAPFSSNLVTQVMSCPASASNSTAEIYIRFLLNDGAVPLTGIAHCETPNKDGLCLLSDFVQGMQERIAQVDFAYDCFGNYTVPNPDPIVDGRMIQ